MALFKEYKAGTYKDSDELTKAKQTADYWNNQELQDFTYDDFKESDRTTGYYNQMSSLVKPTWDKSNNQWWNKLTDTMNAIENREKFSYDVNGDALYQQYKDQYVNQGKMAMMDTMGQAAAMTGGYGNSYAQSVGQQAYQGYLQQLTDKIPELYQMALDKYNSEGDEMYNKLSAYGSLYSTEYGEHRDAVSDYNADRSYLGDMWSKSHTMDMNEYTTNRDTKMAEVDSYNSNITENRKNFNDIVTNLTNSEWGKYVDSETIAQKAIEIYNSNQNNVAQIELAENELDEKKRQFNTQFEASTGYTTSGQKSTTFTGDDGGDDFQRYTYAGTDDGKSVFYRDGKKYTVEKGVNPYTGTKNKDTKYGTFNNGYQPDNIGGKKLKKTGEQCTVNGVVQSVWKTPDGKEWYWDGTENQYLPY